MSPRPLFALALILTTAPIARAQQPPPAPPIITSQLRQRLRAEILRTASQTNARYSNTRPTLALPLAQLGDWKTALRWTAKENDMNSPRQANILWHWRAMQLARGGKWNEVAPAAAHLSQPAVRADALLFAARQMIERGVRLGSPLPQSRQLEEFLNSAASLLASASSAQQSYRAYLYARGGDVAASRRIFARIMPQAQRQDARSLIEAKTSKGERVSYFTADNVRAVLRWQATSGLLSDTVNYAKNHLDSADDISLSWWIAGARNSSDLKSLDELVEQLPTSKRVLSLFSLAMSNANLGYRDRAIAQFESAHQLIPEILATDKSKYALTPDKQQNAILQDRAYFIYPALLTALVIKDDDLIAQTETELREVARAMPPKSNFIKLEEIPSMAPAYKLFTPEVFTADKPLSASELAGIFEQLRAAPPSDLQFRALENLATRFYLLRKNDELLQVAQTMLSTARALQKAESAKRAAEKPSLFNPYWPQSPRVLTSIFWLQRAGDAATATQFARGFAQKVPANERPYAALALTQLGFFDLADQVFDPKIEIPRVAAQQAANWKTNRVDWSLFASWNDFAATQARFRAPDAPFRWIDKIESPDNRAQVLVAWVAALFPVAPDEPPYVRVTPNGSSSAVAGYAGTG